jgi:hypothetical protein
MTGAEPDDWGAFVNECGIFAHRGGADWWLTYHGRQATTGRITTLAESIAGGHHHVLCESEEHAEWLREHMISQGIHKSHLKVRRLSVAKATADKRRAASDERAERVRAAVESRATDDAGRPARHVENVEGF